MNNCTVLVCSCDKYEDIWDPFFTLYKKNCSNLNLPIVLNTESKDYKFEGLDIKTLNLYGKDDKAVTWSQRLIDTLNCIDSELILMLLDDFFIVNAIDDQKINDCIKWMLNDRNIAAFYLVPLKKDSINDNKYPGFVLRSKKDNYMLSCQAAIWRKEHLLKYLRPHESPWEFEVLGSKRCKRYDDKFYVYSQNNSTKIIDYDWEIGGALHRGKWTKSGLKIINDNNIKIDTSIRGYYMPDEFKESKLNYYLSRMNPKDILRIIKTRYLSYKK